MLTQAVLALVLVGQVSAAWAIPFLALQGWRTCRQTNVKRLSDFNLRRCDWS